MPNMPSHTPACDHQIVGALINDTKGRVLMVDRVQDPPGAAFPCGHYDQHGGWYGALTGEVREETGLTVISARPVIVRWVDNRCSRTAGPLGIGHIWTVFKCAAEGELTLNPLEVTNARWVFRDELCHLARRTVMYARGHVDEDEWRRTPGLEPAWAVLLSEEGIGGFKLLDLRAVDRAAVLRLAMGLPRTAVATPPAVPSRA